MKQQLLDALKAKFEGVSDKILDRIADKLAKTVTKAEDVETAVAGVTFQQVIESYGDSRATEAQQTAVKNYETKHNLKDGKPVEPEPKPTPKPQGGGDDVPEWAKAMQEQLKNLQSENAQLRAERTTEARRAQLSALTSKLDESLRKGYDRIPVDQMSDEDFGKLLTDVNGEVEAISQKYVAKGGGRPFVAAEPTSDKLTKEQEAAIAQREGQPKADGQPF